MNAVVLAKKDDSSEFDEILFNDGCERYYFINYERGNWPKIFAKILQTMSEYKFVYYGPDVCSVEEILDGSPITLDELFKISKYWVENGNKPYFNR